MSQQQNPDLSQLSDRSFLTSLDDDELVALINRLSQRKKAEKEEAEQAPEDQVLTEDETDRDDEQILSPSIPALDTDESHEHSSSISFPLAQPQSQQPLPSDENEPVFGDYETYFATKARHQQIEDEKYIEWDKKRREIQGLDEKRSDIFKGCVIYVNGYTRPSIATIHKLVILHGGKFLHFLSSKGAATHIIATRLTPRKKLEFKNYKVVKPEWITQSIEAGKLLRWTEFTLIEPEYGQKRLPFAHKEIEPEDKPENEPEEDEGKTTETEEREEDNSELLPLTQKEEEPQPDPTAEEHTITIDSKHPDFLKTFFAKSRLHHLSTWKADLRAEFLAKALEQIKASPRPKKSKDGFRLILHVDFDCFFATASALAHPELDFKNTPVCVSHGGASSASTADVASCNYVCRKFGVRNGMWVREAKKLCPQLVCLDYDFPTYERISKMFYGILLDLKPDSVLPVSIDEALVEITSFIDPEDHVAQVTEFCQRLREEVFERTQCTVSCGVSKNVLLAKLSLRKAKPDGFFYLHNNIEEFLDELPVRDLPGAGGSIEQKLINNLPPRHSGEPPLIHDLRAMDKATLEKIFGGKTAQKLYDYARGVDDTSIDISENPEHFMRKSVSIDINWGIRFDTIGQVDDFLFKVAKELCLKLQKINMVASMVTLKLLKRAKNAPVDPPKFLGCGQCDAFSKSSRLGVGTDDFKIIGTEARAVFRHIGCDPNELRGVSIQVTKLSEKKKETQKRLPFAKIDFETYKKQKLEESPKKPEPEPEPEPEEQQEEEFEELNTTQYQIPSDVDSSVLEELPSFLRDKIEKQRDKAAEPVYPVPMEVDPAVLRELPPDIQEELKAELRRRNIGMNPRTPSKRRVYLQQTWGAHGEAQFVRVVSPRKSPSKRQLKSPEKRTQPSTRQASPRKPAMTLSQMDADVLNELPASVRNAVLDEWEMHEKVIKTEYEKLKARVPVAERELIGDLTLDHFLVSKKLPPFQKKTRPREILNLIDSWIVKTKENGPHEKDWEVFATYMSKLKKANKTFYLNMKQTLKTAVITTPDLCDKWLETLKKYR